MVTDSALTRRGLPASKRISVGDIELDTLVMGDGPPVVLLHGYPQTKYMWRHQIPILARHFTVIAPDLRGYGDSDKPPSGEDHSGYSKRAMARDIIALMDALGFSRFSVVGHDRGARVAYRLTLDNPDRVEKLAVLDIIPTLTVFETVNQEVASSYYHWFFLSQPKDFPERLIGAEPAYYLRHTLHSWSSSHLIFDQETFAEYLRCFSDPACITATCEDYRAGATIDLAHDRADWGTRLDVPLLTLWGTDGLLERQHDVLAIWWAKANEVRGQAIPSGHFLAEERPAETLHHLWSFLTDEPFPDDLTVPEGPAP
ncbi:MAG: alpha/beta hydrolase [Pseudomonadota bacterium]